MREERNSSVFFEQRTDMKRVDARIISNKKVAPDFYKMTVKSAYLAGHAKPGQFIEIKCTDGQDPLLRRPLGCHRISKDTLTILYEVVGKGTALLSGKKAGDAADIIGPLGNGFKLRSSGEAVLIAGGIGVAPIAALAEALIKRKNKVSVIIGAKKKSHIMCAAEFRSMGCRVLTVTEDGSIGAKGLVTDVLSGLLKNSRYSSPGTSIYACGPNGMMKAIWTIAKEKDIPCQFSFESHMACGVGVCLGCPIKVRSGLIDFEYKMVCKDGPVFNAEEIAW
jgi:dihydroorotate dehydrogenase electron transfer subunit